MSAKSSAASAPVSPALGPLTIDMAPPPAFWALTALIAALPPLILALTIQRYLVRGLSFGAVKA